MKKKTILFLVVIVLISSCSDERFVANQFQQEFSASNEKRDELKFTFGKALAKALGDSPSLRELIKQEALIMFNNDYDVLYHKIKGTQISDGLTVRQLLLKYFEVETQLIEIENNLPLLTIFVPILPEDSFSAELWNTDNQIPLVGITSFKTNDVRVVDSKSLVQVIDAGLVPDFPVVVIKENERVVATVRSNVKGGGRSFRTSDDMTFTFLADCFDGSIKKEKATVRQSFNTDQKLIDAYNIYNGIDGWHRDYIYYGISPTQTSGPFTYDYIEQIASFKLVGDPVSAYIKISDQSTDPRLLFNYFWTEGFFEFKVRTLLNAKNGIGEELVTYFAATPADLFIWNTGIGGTRGITGLKSMDINLPLFPWDLDDYASTIKIEIEEVDVTETFVISESRTVKFATNFAIEGTIKKIGLKFGASLAEDRIQSIQKTYSVGNDPLGSVIVNFADDILLSSGTQSGNQYWNTREYSSGWFSISVEPKRVQ